MDTMTMINILAQVVAIIVGVSTIGALISRSISKRDERLDERLEKGINSLNQHIEQVRQDSEAGRARLYQRLDERDRILNNRIEAVRQEAYATFASKESVNETLRAMSHGIEELTRLVGNIRLAQRDDNEH